MNDACRLYLITPPRIDDLNAFAGDLETALSAGDVACVQLRLKSPDGVSAGDDELLFATELLAPIARKHGAAFLINDRPDLALQAGADGVHIGQSDVPYKEARALLGDNATVGVTCHNSRHLAMIAGEAGADYVAFGAFFSTETKEATAKADPALLEWWAYATTVPCVAIGGISPENCGALVRAGADFIAASSSVWSSPDGPEAAVKAFEAAIRKS